MPRKKDDDKIQEILSAAKKSLDDFNRELKGSLLAWLRREHIDSDDIMKKLSDARAKASEAHIMIDELGDMIDNGKRTKNSRFASNVVRKFLENSL